jgi:hypothetical protein
LEFAGAGISDVRSWGWIRGSWPRTGGKEGG